MTESGPAKLQKTDIFRKMMWFSYNNENDWHSITCERVNEILEINTKGKKVFNLQVNEASDIEDLAAKSTRELELLDKKFSSNSSNKKKKKPRNKNRNSQVENSSQKMEDTNPNQKNSPSKPIQENPQQQAEQGQRGQSRSKKNRNNRNRNKNQRTGTDVPAQGINPPKRQGGNKPNPKPAGGGIQAKPKGGEAKKTSPNQNAEGKPTGKRKFPPRKNQGPNPNSSGNE
jgi:hypothetical protein